MSGFFLVVEPSFHVILFILTTELLYLLRSFGLSVLEMKSDWFTWKNYYLVLLFRSVSLGVGCSWLPPQRFLAFPSSGFWEPQEEPRSLWAVSWARGPCWPVPTGFPPLDHDWTFGTSFLCVHSVHHFGRIVSVFIHLYSELHLFWGLQMCLDCGGLLWNFPSNPKVLLFWCLTS